MKLEKTYVEPGEWLVVKDAAPRDLRDVELSLNGEKYPAFVEGRDVMVRCPDLPLDAQVRVAVNGSDVGRVIVRGHA